MPSSISHSDAHKAELRGVREGALPAGLRQTASQSSGAGAAGADARYPEPPVGGDRAVVPSRGDAADGRVGMECADPSRPPCRRHRRQPAGVGRSAARRRFCARLRSSATAASCSTPTRRGFRQLTGVRPVQVCLRRHRFPRTARAFRQRPEVSRSADCRHGGHDAISARRGSGSAATAVHNYAKNDKPSQLTGLWIDRWLQQYLAFLDRRLPTEHHAAEVGPWLAQARRQPLRRCLENR